MIVPVSDTSSTCRGPRSNTRVHWLLLIVAFGLFAGVVFIRHGPISGSDADGVTLPATALADGDLTAAASQDYVPNPPGYVLAASPLVLIFRPLIGAEFWCLTPSRAEHLRNSSPFYSNDPTFAHDVGECGFTATMPNGRQGPARPPWYHSQGLLGLLAWIALGAGSLSLLRAVRPPSGWSAALLLGLLAVLPAASDGLTQSFHPQDILCVGAMAAGLAQAVRRRWILAGALFGLAFLSKQFVLLAIVPVIVASPGWRERVRVVGPAVVIAFVGILPFWVVAPGVTFDNVTTNGTGGASDLGGTVVDLLHVSQTLRDLIIRDGPIVVALLLSLWARRRSGTRLLTPVPLLGLTLACLASRLLLEAVLLPYYLLAASVMFIVLDLAARRPPIPSVLWIAATTVVAGFEPTRSVPVALAVLALSLLAIVAGMWPALAHLDRRMPAARPSRYSLADAFVRFRLRKTRS